MIWLYIIGIVYEVAIIYKLTGWVRSGGVTRYIRGRD